MVEKTRTRVRQNKSTSFRKTGQPNSLHLYDLQGWRKVKDLLKPLLSLTRGPPYFLNSVRKDTRKFRNTMFFWISEPRDSETWKGRVPNNHRYWSHQFLKILNMGSIYWILFGVPSARWISSRHWCTSIVAMIEFACMHACMYMEWIFL